MYLLFETIKVIDGQPVNLEYHEERMKMSCLTYFGESCKFSLISKWECPEKYQQGIVKCRVSYNQDHFIKQFSVYKYQTANTFRLVESGHLDYSLKYIDRSGINLLMEDSDKFDDIILIKGGLVTDSSYANLVFQKSGINYTPEFALLNGTKRQFYLDNGKISLASIGVENFQEYDKVTRINAMIDLEDADWVDVGRIDLGDFI
jgi:4-amino-4-deoxychorismate lyase